MTVVRVELEFEDGRREAAEGADAEAVWGGLMDCACVALAHGVSYRGPKLTPIGDGWVAAEEALPLPGRDVLAYLRWTGYDIARIEPLPPPDPPDSGDTCRWEYEGGYTSEVSGTHWRELPDPPRRA